MTGLGLKLPHGPHRRPMGGFAAFPSPETSSEARATMARCPRRVQRDSLGAAHRRSLARSARPLSALSNLPSPLPAVAARRDPDATLARPRRRPAGPRQTGFVGDLHRRQLQFGEKRGTAVGPTRRGKGSKIMAIADGHGFPVACDVASASPHETKLVEGTLQHRFTRAWPERMIGDTAYDSDPLDRQLWREHRIRMIAPNRPNRLNLTQDRRELRRYCRRWKIERLFAWLHNFRRLVTRWEFYEANFLGMLQLGCLIILLRNLCDACWVYPALAAYPTTRASSSFAVRQRRSRKSSDATG